MSPLSNSLVLEERGSHPVIVRHGRATYEGSYRVEKAMLTVRYGYRTVVTEAGLSPENLAKEILRQLATANPQSL